MFERLAAGRAKRVRAARAPSTTNGGVAHETKVEPLVLIVDDIEDNRTIYSEFFVHEGMRIAHASDGEHGLMKAHAILPDIIVMDLSLPVLDGWEATRELKRHPRTKHIPVIAITGHVTRENLRRAKQAGADAVLTKPCMPDALLAEIRKLLV
jgi:CheY-like chemotaxis protein